MERLATCRSIWQHSTALPRRSAAGASRAAAAADFELGPLEGWDHVDGSRAKVRAPHAPVHHSSAQRSAAMRRLSHTTAGRSISTDYGVRGGMGYILKVRSAATAHTCRAICGAQPGAAQVGVRRAAAHAEERRARHRRRATWPCRFVYLFVCSFLRSFVGRLRRVAWCAPTRPRRVAGDEPWRQRHVRTDRLERRWAAADGLVGRGPLPAGHAPGVNRHAASSPPSSRPAPPPQSHRRTRGRTHAHTRTPHRPMAPMASGRQASDGSFLRRQCGACARCRA